MAFFDTFTITTLVIFLIIVAVIIGLTVLAIFLIRRGQKKGRELLNQIETNPEAAAKVVNAASKLLAFL